MSLDLRELQGLLTSAYPRSPAARYLLMEVLDAGDARAWLRRLIDRVTFADEVEEQIRTRSTSVHPNLNVAFTSAGLAALGTPADRMTDFSREFREGIGTAHRQRVLGDLDDSPSDPRRWLWGGPRNPPIHIVILLFARDEATLDSFIDDMLSGRTGVRIVRTVLTVSITGAREHFGFRDGIASPWVDGLHRPRRESDRIAAGEVLLGHPDLTGRPEPYPTIGRDGSYLVIRQLAQDVEGFWTALRTTVGDEAAVRWAAKMMGRWPDGSPLIRAPDGPDRDASDDFGYRDDPDGVRCPLGAHIRRTNPRDSGAGAKPAVAVALVNRHRLLRRGRAFGLAADPATWPAGLEPVRLDNGRQDDSGHRGVVFACLGASLARQFEFVQHSWMHNPKFAGLYDENDPIAGSPHRRRSQPPAGFTFTAPGPVVNHRIELPEKFVHCIGGGYFFVPGRTALHAISAESATVADPGERAVRSP